MSPADNVFSGLVFVVLGCLSLFSGISAKVWRRDESRFRVGALILGLLFVMMGVLALLGYIVIDE